MWKYRRRPEAKILFPVGGANADVWMGVRLMCNDVRSGFGDGAEGEM